MPVTKKRKAPITGMPAGFSTPSGRPVGVKPVPSLQLAQNYQQMPEFRQTLFQMPQARQMQGTVPKNSPYYYMGNQAPVGAPAAGGGGGAQKYYTYKAEVPMQAWNSSQSIGFTPGKGYYVKQATAPQPVGGPSAPGSINIGGFSPNFGAGIEGDWEYQAALADLTNSDRADQASLNQALKSLAVQYGGDLSGLVKQGLIDQSAADAGAQNNFSFVKELDRALGRGQAGAVDDLAARGSLRSGGLAVMQGMLAENYQREQTKGMNDLLSQIGGLRTGAAQASASRRSNLAGVRSNIAMRLAADPRYQPRSAATATWNANVGGYVTPDGRIYDKSGQLLY